MATNPPQRRDQPGEPEPGGRGGPGGAGGAGGPGGGEKGEPGGRGGEGGPGGAGRSYERGDALSRWLDWTVRAAVVASLMLSGLVFAQINRNSQCNGEFSDRTAVLTPVVDKEREAQRATDAAQAALWLAVNPDERTRTPAQQARLRALFVHYQAALTARIAAQAEADKARAANPLPTCNT